MGHASMSATCIILVGSVAVACTPRAHSAPSPVVLPVAPPPVPTVAPPAAPSILVEITKMPSSPASTGVDVNLDQIKGGKLMSYGVSLGAGYAAHMPLGGTTYEAGDINTSLIPYIVFYPFMFIRSGPETRAYCSASWGFATSDDAQRIANNHAKGRIERIKKNLAKEAHAERILQGINRTDTAEEVEKFEKEAKDIVGWDPEDQPYCWWRRFGAYVGKPFSISPTISPKTDLSDESNPQKPVKDATPASSSVYSIGLAYSPNSAVSLFTGATLWRSGEISLTRNRSFYTWTIGIGGNVDIFTALFKGG